MAHLSEEKSAEQKLTTTNNVEYETKAYKKRWYILAVFIWYSGINAYQWVEYTIVNDLVAKYYGVSSIAVDWTAIIFMFLYPFFVVPASYIIDKKGLKAAGLIGCIGTAVGTWVKIFSVREDLFWVVMIGQAIVSASQIIILCLPPKIAAVWFKPNEASTACALGVFGTQLGTAVGYILTPLIVPVSDDPEIVASGLKTMCWSLSASIIPAVIAVIFYFPSYPPKAPSVAQAKERFEKPKFNTKSFFKSMSDLFYNKGFVIHMVGYSISIAVFSGIGTLLSQFIIFYFPDQRELAGAMGFTIVVAGMVGSISFGVILDKTKKYKETTFVIYLLSAFSVIAFMYALEFQSKYFTYASCAFLGVFTSAYWSVGFELAVELTYPSEESTTTGILFAMTQLAGFLTTAALGYLNQWFGPYWSLASQAALLFIGTVVTGFIPNDLRRQAAFAAEKKAKFEPIPLMEKV